MYWNRKRRIQNKRNRRKKGSERKSYGNQGIITVFVTLIMVPVVVITGIMVDVSRLKLYSSQAVMTADAYGDSVLSEFDNLLKELYGLFSVTQNKEGLEAIDALTKSMGYSFNPNGDGSGLSGFMPYKDADVELVYEPVAGASLSNNNVLETQIADFMKYRIVEEVVSETGILDTLGQFDHMDADMEAMESRNDLTDSSAKVLEKIDEYYKELKKLAAYPEYLEGRENAFQAYSGKLTAIAESDEYAEYVNYLANKDAIEAAREKYNRILEAAENAEADDEEESDAESGENEEDKDDDGEVMSPEELELCDQYVNTEDYKKSIREQLESVQNAAGNHSGTPIDFENTGKAIENLGKKEKELRETLQTLKAQIEKLKSQLAECSQDIKAKMEEEIRDLENISAMADDFQKTYQLIEQINQDTSKNSDNRTLLLEEVPKLDAVRENLLTGNVQPGDSYWAHTIPLVWYDFRDDKAGFYKQLQDLCEVDTDGEGNKKVGDQEKKRADDARKNAEKELEEDETTSARSITTELAAQLSTQGASSGEVPGLLTYFSGGLSFDSLSGIGSNVIDKFLLTAYDFGMFSSRVTGTKPKEEADPAGTNSGEESEEYSDYSLTKVKMSGDVNYLYGAELEYLLGGYNDSQKNLNKTRNIICGVRMTMNFASSYLIDEVDNAISAIANMAAEAVLASGVGAAAAPLVRVTVSGALRLAFSTIETVQDWKSLKERQSVVFLKRKAGELQAKEALEALLGREISGSSTQNSIKLSYENYLYILLCLLVDNNTLLSRTSNLITLNVNQAVNDEDQLTTLDFNMADTVTAVKTTCKVKMDFAVVPDNLMEMYLKGTDTEALIDVLENHYFGYSIIRGY